MKLSEYAGERDDARFWARVRPAREPARTRFFLPGVLLALCFSVPWYFGDSTGLLAGLPLWVWTSLLGSAALSVLTGLSAWLCWDDQDPPMDEAQAETPHETDPEAP